MRWLSRLSAIVFLAAQLAPFGYAELTCLSTPDGIRFGLVGVKQTKPAPTLLIFAGSLEQSLEDANYNGAGTVAAQHGFLLVSLDLPSHGRQKRVDERAGLDGWRDRIARGENIVAQFVAHASSVLDFLIAQRYTDPARVAVSGTSRGGFLALHLAASDPRVHSVVAFAPVTDLLALREFAGLESNALVRSLALPLVAGKLVDRSIWIVIGGTDHRVSTDAAIRFTRRVAEYGEAQDKRPNLELHVYPTEGHHVTPDKYSNAAAWLMREVKTIAAQ